MRIILRCASVNDRGEINRFDGHSLQDCGGVTVKWCNRIIAMHIHYTPRTATRRFRLCTSRHRTETRVRPNEMENRTRNAISCTSVVFVVRIVVQSEIMFTSFRQKITEYNKTVGSRPCAAVACDV